MRSVALVQIYGWAVGFPIVHLSSHKNLPPKLFGKGAEGAERLFG